MERSFVGFFCVDFKPRTTNNSLATTMFEGDNAIPSQPAPPNSNSAVISTSSPAPLTQASLGQAMTTGTFVVPSLGSTFSTLLAPAYGFSSLPLPSGSGSQTAGGGVVSAFPAISVSSAAVGKDFVIGPGYSPIPHKLVTKITTGLFVELEDLLPDNLKANKSETQMFLEGKLVVAPARKRIVEIQNILT